MSRALWISFTPVLVAITGFVILDFLVQTSLATLGFLGFLVVGFASLLVLTEMAQGELDRGSSVGHYIPRALVIAITFFGVLVGTSALAIALFSAPFEWILLHVVGTAPAAVVAVILTVHSHRLPIEPYEGPWFEVKWR